MAGPVKEFSLSFAPLAPLWLIGLFAVLAAALVVAALVLRRRGAILRALVFVALLGALANPSLSITVVEKTYDEDGEFTGIAKRTITFAPVTHGNQPAFYFGRLTTENHPFLVNRETYQKLAGGLLEKP